MISFRILAGKCPFEAAPSGREAPIWSLGAYLEFGSCLPVGRGFGAL
jgi:hypothetical protein